MSATLHSFLSVGNVDELSPVMAEPPEPVELQLAAATASAIDRLWARAARQNAPSARLSDREREQVDLATLDSVGMDMCASLDDCDDATIGAMLRREHERRVLEKLANR